MMTEAEQPPQGLWFHDTPKPTIEWPNEKVNPVYTMQRNADRLAPFRAQDYLYSPVVEAILKERQDLIEQYNLTDDDVYDITFEREGWEDRVKQRHPEIKFNTDRWPNYIRYDS